MRPHDWRLLNFFSDSENWGNPNSMSLSLLLLMDRIRGKFEKNQYFIIHCAADRTGHVEKSEHYLRPCPATDFHVENLPYVEAIIRMEESLRKLKVAGLVSLGIYPNWNNPGFHLGYTYTKKRWGYIVRDKVPEMVPYKEAYNYAVKKFS